MESGNEKCLFLAVSSNALSIGHREVERTSIDPRLARTLHLQLAELACFLYPLTSLLPFTTIAPASDGS
jgi:hypothetical protein